jgi:hypothetical protein
MRKLFWIYKEKQLREALQNELNKQGLGGNGQSGTNEAN